MCVSKLLTSGGACLWHARRDHHRSFAGITQSSALPGKGARAPPKKHLMRALFLSVCNGMRVLSPRAGLGRGFVRPAGHPCQLHFLVMWRKLSGERVARLQN